MLSRDDIVNLLEELANELATQGIHGDLFLVGGAAMALAYSTRRATRDLDAIFEPKQVIYEAAQRVGDRHEGTSGPRRA
jgi:methylmalonyl-CoA mutase cobalamin-binding subunit